ncbi:MAG: SUMF1/EgtB/PvdO family nonheme iron enzyme [Burkholderiales bacterium]
MWDANGRLIRTLDPDIARGNIIAISPDGRSIVSASRDGTVRAHALDVGDGIAAAGARPIAAHTGAVNGVAFSADAALILSASEDGSARLRLALDGANVAALVGQSGPVADARFSPDGQTIVTASRDGTLRLFGRVPPAGVDVVSCAVGGVVSAEAQSLANAIALTKGELAGALAPIAIDRSLLANNRITPTRGTVIYAPSNDEQRALAEKLVIWLGNEKPVAGIDAWKTAAGEGDLGRPSIVGLCGEDPKPPAAQRADEPLVSAADVARQLGFSDRPSDRRSIPSVDPRIVTPAPPDASAAQQPADPLRSPTTPDPRLDVPLAQRARGQVFTDCEGCPEMVVIPGGRFTMGSPDSEKERFDDEGPQHDVTIPAAIAVGRFEVTREQFARFVRETNRSMTGGCWARNKDSKAEIQADKNWLNPGFDQKDDHPVVCVNWQDATTYAEWLSTKTGKKYRLLSEAEWEYAARAETRTARYWGEAFDPAGCEFANVADDTARRTFNFPWEHAKCSDGHATTAPVGRFKPNAFGLADMLGNVWEWTVDCWNDSYRDAPANGSAWMSGKCDQRVVRGGGWYFNPRLARAANRSRDDSSDRIDFVGFRLARTD